MHGDTHLGARYYHWLTLLWDKGKHSVAAKSQIGTPLGIAVEGPFYPFLVDFPGGERLWGNINPLSAHTYVDARFVGNWYGVSVWNGIFRVLSTPFNSQFPSSEFRLAANLMVINASNLAQEKFTAWVLRDGACRVDL